MSLGATIDQPATSPTKRRRTRVFKSAGNDRFPAWPRGADWDHPPVSTAELRDQYCAAVGIRETALIGHAYTPGSRSAEICELVRRRLPIAGLGFVSVLTPLSEPLLVDAIMRWVLARCRSYGGAQTYLKVIIRWALSRPDPDLRSLSAQMAVHPSTVVDWLRSLEEQGQSVRSIVLHREILRSWYGWLQENRLLADAPINREAKRAWRIRPDHIERGDGTRQALTHEEAQLMTTWALTQAEPEAGLAVLLQAVAGLRSEEVTQLERRHLTAATDGVHRLSVQGKGRRQRLVVLEDVVVRAWRRYEAMVKLPKTRTWLLQLNHHAYAARTVQSWAKQGLKACGRPDISSHDLRRTAATLLTERGATLEQVKKILGHANLETTARCYVARVPPLTVTTGLVAPQTEQPPALT